MPSKTPGHAGKQWRAQEIYFSSPSPSCRLLGFWPAATRILPPEATGNRYGHRCRHSFAHPHRSTLPVHASSPAPGYDDAQAVASAVDAGARTMPAREIVKVLFLRPHRFVVALVAALSIAGVGLAARAQESYPVEGETDLSFGPSAGPIAGGCGCKSVQQPPPVVRARRPIMGVSIRCPPSSPACMPSVARECSSPRRRWRCPAAITAARILRVDSDFSA